MDEIIKNLSKLSKTAHLKKIFYYWIDSNNIVYDEIITNTMIQSTHEQCWINLNWLIKKIFHYASIDKFEYSDPLFHFEKRFLNPTEKWIPLNWHSGTSLSDSESSFTDSAHCNNAFRRNRFILINSDVFGCEIFIFYFYCTVECIFRDAILIV